MCPLYARPPEASWRLGKAGPKANNRSSHFPPFLAPSARIHLTSNSISPPLPSPALQPMKNSHDSLSLHNSFDGSGDVRSNPKPMPAPLGPIKVRWQQMGRSSPGFPKPSLIPTCPSINSPPLNPHPLPPPLASVPTAGQLWRHPHTQLPEQAPDQRRHPHRQERRRRVPLRGGPRCPEELRVWRRRRRRDLGGRRGVQGGFGREDAEAAV